MQRPEFHSRNEDDTLSAFIDDELSEDMARTAIKRLAANRPERKRHAEYCAIGDAMRGLPFGQADLTDRVMAALEKEPTVLAPMRRAPDRRPVMWLAAATVAALTWGLWAAAPRHEPPAQVAAAQPGNVQAYLAAHEDYAQAVDTAPDMHYTRVSLTGLGK